MEQKIETIQVTDKATLDELYDESALTIEGLSPEPDSLKEFADWIEEHTAFKRKAMYIIEGRVMNEVYGLTGTNAYPPTDCTLVSVKLSDLVEPLKLVTPRLAVGGRWFDDVVDNNACREEKKRNG